MSTIHRKSALVAALFLVGAPTLSGCEMPIALAPRGPAAQSIADIWWILFWTAAIVTVLVFVLLVIALLRSRRREGRDWNASRSNAFVLVGGAAVPTVILVGVTVLTFGGLSLFDEPRDAQLTITVTGHTFWWEAEYDGEEFATANEIHIPTDVPVRIYLESADVIHSFWVPQLAGKIEMIPGWTNVIYLEANEAGAYLGKCAEFCGTQHANMEFLVVAQTAEEFEEWLELQRSEAVDPATELERRGQQVFIAEPCALCHTIRGVNHATTDVGPDLTHLASRSTLAARTIANTEGGLAGWIADPQGIKPGNHMPEINLASEDLQALVTYLRSLE